MLRFVPPAGTRLEVAQILHAAKAAAFDNHRPDKPMKMVADKLRACSAFPTCSGRAALSLILRGLKRLRPGRKVVVLPAYTCFSVAASVVRAGLEPCPVDIDPQTLDFDFPQLEAVSGQDLLCIVTSNLFGLVNDLERIRQIAAVKGAFVVDDAAQALGASRGGVFAGLRGDVGLFSFGRGKALAAIEGGLIVTNSEEISSSIAIEVETLPRPTFSHSVWIMLQMLIYALFLHPRLYWIPNSIPSLKLGATEFAPDFPMARVSQVAVELLPQLLLKLDEANAGRVRNADSLRRGLDSNAAFKVPKLVSGTRPIYTRFPVVACDGLARDRALIRLRHAGIGASPSYPSAICDIQGLGPFRGPRFRHCLAAESLSRRLFTLPTHAFVSRPDVNCMVEILAAAQ